MTNPMKSMTAQYRGVQDMPKQDVQKKKAKTSSLDNWPCIKKIMPQEEDSTIWKIIKMISGLITLPFALIADIFNKSINYICEKRQSIQLKKVETEKNPDFEKDEVKPLKVNLISESSTKIDRQLKKNYKKTIIGIICISVAILGIATIGLGYFTPTPLIPPPPPLTPTSPPLTPLTPPPPPLTPTSPPLTPLTPTPPVLFTQNLVRLTDFQSLIKILIYKRPLVKNICF